MRSAIFLVSLLGLASMVSGYSMSIDSTQTYYGFGYITPGDLVYNGNGNTNNGIYYFQYTPSSMTLSYHVGTSLSVIGSVSLNGPTNCDTTGGYGSKECSMNTAPSVVTLGQGISPTSTTSGGASTTGYQMFSGSITLTANEQYMVRGLISTSLHTHTHTQ